MSKKTHKKKKSKTLSMLDAQRLVANRDWMKTYRMAIIHPNVLKAIKEYNRAEMKALAEKEGGAQKAREQRTAKKSKEGKIDKKHRTVLKPIQGRTCSSTEIGVYS